MRYGQAALLDASRPRHQFIVGGCVVRFARRDDKAKRQTFAIGAGMKLARKAAARAAKTLVLSPRPFERGSRCCRSPAPDEFLGQIAP